MSGLRALVIGPEADNIFSVRTYQRMPLVLKPGKLLYPLQPNKNFEGLPRAPEDTDRARTSTNVSGLASRVDCFKFCRKVLVRRDRLEKVRKNIIIHLYGSSGIGFGVDYISSCLEFLHERIHFFCSSCCRGTARPLFGGIPYSELGTSKCAINIKYCSSKRVHF